MLLAARLLPPLAAILCLTACGHVAPLTPTPSVRRGELPAEVPLPANALLPSPRLLVGRILEIDADRGFAFVALTGEPPAAALVAGAELSTRTEVLRETSRLRVSRYVRGRTLGAEIVSGRPARGDEVVFQAP